MTIYIEPKEDCSIQDANFFAGTEYRAVIVDLWEDEDKDNLFGMKRNGRYASYRTWQESVADYKARISSRYTGGDYFAFLKRIGYAADPNYQAKVRRCMR